VFTLFGKELRDDKVNRGNWKREFRYDEVNTGTLFEKGIIGELSRFKP